MSSVRKRSGAWYARWVDADGVKRELRAGTDKRAAEQLAAAMESEASKVRAGLVDAKSLAYRDHEARSLPDHLADFRAYLIGKGSTETHANLTHNRVARLLDIGKARRLSDLAPSRVTAALKSLRDGGLSLRSIHHHIRCVKGFSRWLWRDGRAREDTLAHLANVNADPDRRRVRRALTPDEAARLVEAAERGPVVCRLSGRDRSALYRLALGTGFRAAELASLTPEAFDLEGDPPTVTVTAAYSKRRRNDCQPIRPDLADALRPWLAAKPPRERVFGKLTKHTAVMLRSDLEAAGITVEDASGRVVDFHALRHTYVSTLARSAAPVKVVQSLARHSTPTLTLGTYTHLEVYDQTAALEALPDLTRPGSETEAPAMLATGTDGGRINKRLAHPLPTGGDGSGRKPSDTVAIADVGMFHERDGASPREPLENKGSDASSRAPSGPVERRGWDSNPRIRGTYQRFSRPSQEPTQPEFSQAVSIASTNALPTPCPPDSPRQPSLPPDLAELVDAWGDLPEAIRQAITVLARAAGEGRVR